MDFGPPTPKESSLPLMGCGPGNGDSSPGGALSAYLQEDGVGALLLEDGTSDLLLEG